MEAPFQIAEGVSISLKRALQAPGTVPAFYAQCGKQADYDAQQALDDLFGLPELQEKLISLSSSFLKIKESQGE